MAAQLGMHPSADALRGFSADKLDDPPVAVIMNHIDGCPDRCRAVAAVSGDDFLNHLRQARSPSSTPTAAESPAGTAPDTKRAASPTANQPPELPSNPQCRMD
jgi:hypothetical protein